MRALDWSVSDSPLTRHYVPMVSVAHSCICVHHWVHTLRVTTDVVTMGHTQR